LGAEKVFAYLKTKGCLRQSLSITRKWLHFVGTESGYVYWSLLQFFREPLSEWASFFTSCT